MANPDVFTLPPSGTGAASLPGALAAYRTAAEQGLHVGMQLYVSREGRTVADLAVGLARDNVAMTPDSLMIWMSATKPVGAVAAAQLWERGLLDLDGPVAAYLPEFGVNGKDQVTTRHILTHTAGFRFMDLGWPRTSWEHIIARICDMPLERGWVPGEKAGYHQTTSWFILGEVVSRVSGLRFDHYVRREIFEPIGMGDSWVGMPPERYDEYGPERIGVLQATDKPPLRPLPLWHTKEAVTHCRPAANGHGPIRELGLFYETLLADGVSPTTGRRILTGQSVQTFTARQRVGMYDHSFRHVIDWGLGFIVNSNEYGVDTVPYGFGAHAGKRTFGHNGFQSSAAFADPDHQVVVAVVCNGAPGEKAHDKRMRSILDAIYADLGLREEPAGWAGTK